MEARRPGVPRRAKPRPIMEQIPQPVARLSSPIPHGELSFTRKSFQKREERKERGETESGPLRRRHNAVQSGNGEEKERERERDTEREPDPSLSLGEFGAELSARLFFDRKVAVT
ncbi:hypothetical protein EYF80_059848 [Liparis tanakae]|uniref:Uncharacterized protein n=1 Tax=Liparis tanakae TaxID=230148 RepID=A0A4Z2ENN8_9TELE|nr:hypothetical protein EYF80_059848 [Liparis tanakae]